MLIFCHPSFDKLNKQEGSKSTNHIPLAWPFELVPYLHRIDMKQTPVCSSWWLAHFKKHVERRICDWQTEHLSLGYVGSRRIQLLQWDLKQWPLQNWCSQFTTWATKPLKWELVIFCEFDWFWIESTVHKLNFCLLHLNDKYWPLVPNPSFTFTNKMHLIGNTGTDPYQFPPF